MDRRSSPASASSSPRPPRTGTARRSASCTTPRSWSTDGAVAWVGPGARRPRGRHARRRRRAAPSSPGSSTATRTWSSPATAPPSSPRAWRASRTPAAASRRRSRRRARPPTDELRAHTARLRGARWPRSARPPSRSRAATGSTSRTEERLLQVASRVHRRRRRSWARTSCRPSMRDDRAAYVDARLPARCSRRAHRYARWVDVFCDTGRVHRRGVTRGAGAGHGRGTACRGCTETSSSYGPGARLAAEFGAASVDHCTHLTRRRTSRRSRDADVVATLLPGAEFSTRSAYPDARRLLDAGVTRRARDRLQPRDRPTSPRCRCASRSPCARCT